MIVVEVKQQVEGERTDGRRKTRGPSSYALGTAVRSATLRPSDPGLLVFTDSRGSPIFVGGQLLTFRRTIRSS